MGSDVNGLLIALWGTLNIYTLLGIMENRA